MKNYSIFSSKACYKNKRFNGFSNGICSRSIKKQEYKNLYDKTLMNYN